MTRPGGARCTSCRVVTEYSGMVQYRTPKGALRWVCDGCADRRRTLGIRTSR